MKCPACQLMLEKYKVQDLVVDICLNGCHGIWFDNFELKRVDEQHESIGEELAELSQSKKTPQKRTDKRACPRCDDTKLKPHFHSVNKEIEIDSCGNCNGVWLDAGELKAIRAAFVTENAKDSAAEKAFLFYDNKLETIRTKAPKESDNPLSVINSPVLKGLMKLFGI